MILVNATKPNRKITNCNRKVEKGDNNVFKTDRKSIKKKKFTNYHELMKITKQFPKLQEKL